MGKSKVKVKTTVGKSSGSKLGEIVGRLKGSPVVLVKSPESVKIDSLQNKVDSLQNKLDSVKIDINVKAGTK